MTEGAKNGTLLPRERYQIVRAQIEFEDSLITQRLSWFVAAQSFLFTAYAITLNAPPANQSAFQEAADQHILIFRMIPVVAIASCLLIYLTVIAGVLAQANLRRLFRPHSVDSTLAGLPPIHGLLFTRILGLSAPLGLPVVFGGVWLHLLTRGIH